MRFANGPYLAAAVFVSYWRVEEHNHMLDLDGIHGATVLLADPTAPPGARFLIEEPITLFIRLIPGSFTGTLPMELRSKTLETDAESFPVPFTGEDAPVDIPLPLRVKARRLGLHWLDVVLGGQLLTRMPLRLFEGRPHPV